MFIPENEREDRKSALGALSKAMSGNLAERLGKKKPAMEIEIGMEKPEGDDMEDMESESDAEVTPEVIDMIKSLYKKFCM